MNPFESMTHVTVYTVLTLFVLLVIALRANPIAITKSFLGALIQSRKYLLHFIALLIILLFNKIELMIESGMHYQADFTKTFYQIEQNFIPMIQSFFRSDILTYVTSYFYVIVFTTIMIASIGIYTYQKNYKLFYALCYGIMINYMVAIPFYLFFPVTEVWAYHPDVKFLMLDAFPTFEQEYRPLSGLNNCFPSLHTSLSITLAVIAAQSGNKFWRIFTAVSAGIVIFAIFYLGIHWFLDMCGGLVLGAFAGRMALRLAEGGTQDARVGARLGSRNLGE